MSSLRDAILDFAERMTFDSLPEEAVAATNALIADTIACAFLGTKDPHAGTVREMQLRHHGYGGLPVWGTEDLVAQLAAGSANAYHARSPGCESVHASGAAVMTVIVPAVLAYADRFGRVSGKDAVTAIAVAADIAVVLSLAGVKDGAALGAGAALAKLARFDRVSMAETLGVIQSQSPAESPNTEETPTARGLKAGFSVRNALTAFDLVHWKLATVPAVFEGADESLAESLGQTCRVTEMSCRPAPPDQDAPDSPEQRRTKFVSAATAALQPLAVDAAERLYDRLLRLESEPEVSVLSHLAAGYDLEEKVI